MPRSLIDIWRAAEADRAIAMRRGRHIGRSEFWGEVAALAAKLPTRKYILNLCTDRYRFMAGFAAALQRRQISLMPSSDAPGVLQSLLADYPDVYALTDTAPPALPHLIYPELPDARPSRPLPDIPDAQPALVLFTSGSTGKPKPVQKSWGVLRHSALAAGVRLGAPHLAGATIIGTVPHQHSYGLESTVLLGLLNDMIVDAGWPLYPADIRRAIAAAPRPRILVTTPVHLRALLAEPDDMPQLDLILSATAPLPLSLAQAAEACFAAPLIEIYGCTEAGQVATRRTTQATQWQCFDGIELSQDGEKTWASGPAVEGSALLHDRIEQTGPANFYLGEREADLVDVAGKRASLAQLTLQLVSIAGVEDGVFIMGESDGRPVPRLMAVAVAPGLSAAEILRALRRQIDPAFLPRPLILVDVLPRDRLGKLPRAALLELGRRPLGRRHNAT
jgi:acyl-coenzyme A synthetase/AMP-(fatty) acid ligase